MSVILNKEALRDFIRTLKPSMAVGTLLSGDRFSCVDEAVGVEADGQIVGVATIAPNGEEASGEPTIVAIYVCHEYRGRGLGRELMIGAVDRCRERGLVPVRVDALSTSALRIAQTLPPEYKSDIKLFDLTMGGMTDDLLLM